MTRYIMVEIHDEDEIMHNALVAVEDALSDAGINATVFESDERGDAVDE